jgi:hypothetical protein
MEGSGRGLIQGIIPGLKRTTKNLRIAGLRAEIWNRDISNAKQVC